MMLDFASLMQKYKMNINGVLHVGAHLAEEAELYKQFKVGHVWWVEANPAVVAKIENKLRMFKDQELIQALVFDEDGKDLSFNVTNYDGMSSSVYEFGTHTQFSPDIHFVQKVELKSSTIDTLARDNSISANFLNLDIQGAEGPALKGASGFLSGVDYVMTEVNKDQVYVGCTQVKDIDKILSDFIRVETYWVPGQGWGDALYIRSSVLNG